MQIIAPLNVLSVMFVLQIVLALTMLLGVAIDSSKYSASRSPGVYILLFVSFIFCLLAIAFTEEFVTVWRPMLGDLSVPTVPRHIGVATFFGLNYLTTFLLITFTGRRHSALMPILFLLPTTSIFLRDAPVMTFFYGTVSAGYYVTLSFRSGGGVPRFMAAPEPLLPSMANDEMEGYNAHRVVALLCLAITLLMGYITRPAPIA